MAMATGNHVRLKTGGKIVVVTGQSGSTVNWTYADGSGSGSFDETLLMTPKTDNDLFITGRNKVGLY
jgi:uncharacterized protein YodC (DUF2158 family)